MRPGARSRVCSLAAPLPLVPRLLVVGAVCGAGASATTASVIHVPAEVPTIEQALTLAEPFDTVLVAPGVYGPTAPLVFGRPSVTLLSEVAREAIIGVGQVLFEQTIDIRSPECAIEGFTIYSAPPCILIRGTAGLARIENNLFYGIGWYETIRTSGTGTTIAGNEFIYCVGPIWTQDPQVRIEGNTFQWNHGGILMTGAGTIRANTFENNASYSDHGEAGSGGAISAWNPPAPLVIEDNRIEANRTDASYPQGPEGKGGGIFLSGAADATIRRNRIVGNQSLNGAGLYAEHSGLVVEENLIAANADSVRDPANPLRGRGGGLYLTNCTGSITANTIAGNIALMQGGGIYIEGPAAPVLDRNIVVANRSLGSGIFCTAAEPSFACNDVWRNDAANYGGCADPTGQDGNLSADPLFCPPFFGGYTLSDASPCAPANAPPGCGLIGAYDVACAAADAPGPRTPLAPARLRVVPNPAFDRVAWLLEPPARAEEVTVRDVAGRHVRSLRGAAAHTWDCTDDTGQRVPSGIYFVEVRSSEGRGGVAKLLLLD